MINLNRVLKVLECSMTPKRLFARSPLPLRWIFQNVERSSQNVVCWFFHRSTVSAMCHISFSYFVPNLLLKSPARIVPLLIYSVSVRFFICIFLHYSMHVLCLYLCVLWSSNLALLEYHFYFVLQLINLCFNIFFISYASYSYPVSLFQVVVSCC